MFGSEFLPQIILLAIVIAVIAKIIQVSIPVKPMLCLHCASQGKPKTKTKGSFLIEVILWLCFILPGLIYSIWRVSSRYKVCPACGQPGMIPLDSPRAQQFLSEK